MKTSLFLTMATITLLAGCSLASPTTDWKTYQDAKNDISFHYPPTWEVVDLQDPRAGVALRSPEYKTISSGKVDFEGEIFVNTTLNPENLSIEDLYATFDDTSVSWFKKFEHSKVSYNKLTGVIFPKIKEGSQAYERTDITIACDGKMVSFSYLYEEEKYMGELVNIAKSLECQIPPVSLTPAAEHNTKTYDNSDLMQEANASENTKIQQTKNSFEYSNTKYGFSLTFPASWGKIKEEVVELTNDDPLVMTRVMLTSYADLQKERNMIKTIHIHIVEKNTNIDVEKELSDYPQGLITENSQYLYYSVPTLFYGMPGNDTEEHRILSEEISRVRQTFRLVGTPTGAPPKDETSGWKTWAGNYFSKATGENFSYSLKYPRDFDVQRMPNDVVYLAFPEDAFQTPKTNYRGADLSISIKDDEASLKNCYKDPSYDNIKTNKQISTTRIINGRTFFTVSIANLGLGQIDDSIRYRLLTDSNCIEVTKTIHTSSISNYPTGTVTQFDQWQAMKILNQMLETLTIMTTVERTSLEMTKQDLADLKIVLEKEQPKYVSNVKPTYTIVVDARNGSYIRARLSKVGTFIPGLPSFYAYKADDGWKIIFSGQETPICSKVNAWNFPTDIISECYDGKKTIQREEAKPDQDIVENETTNVTGGFSYYLQSDNSFAPYKKSALNRICFEPAQRETINEGAIFCFTNTQEALSLLGFKAIDNNCKYYWGTATIEIENLTDKNLSNGKSDPCVESGTCQFNEAKLTEVSEMNELTPKCRR